MLFPNITLGKVFDLLDPLLDRRAIHGALQTAGGSALPGARGVRGSRA